MEDGRSKMEDCAPDSGLPASILDLPSSIFVASAHASVSPRNCAGVSALFASKQRQRRFDVSLLMIGAMSVGQRSGSAMRLRALGTRSHALTIACIVAASSVYSFGFSKCSSRLSRPASSAPPLTGGALEYNV